MPIQPVSGEIKAQPLNDNFSYLDSKASSMIGGPKETFTSLSALNIKYPNGSGSAMLVTDSNGANGYLYTWNGTAWIKGPLYQAQGIATGSVTTQKLDEGILKTYTAEKLIFRWGSMNANDGSLVGVNNIAVTSTRAISYSYVYSKGTKFKLNDVVNYKAWVNIFHENGSWNKSISLNAIDEWILEENSKIYLVVAIAGDTSFNAQTLNLIQKEISITTLKSDYDTRFPVTARLLSGSELDWYYLTINADTGIATASNTRLSSDYIYVPKGTIIYSDTPTLGQWAAHLYNLDKTVRTKDSKLFGNSFLGLLIEEDSYIRIVIANPDNSTIDASSSISKQLVSIRIPFTVGIARSENITSSVNNVSLPLSFFNFIYGSGNINTGELTNGGNNRIRTAQSFYVKKGVTVEIESNQQFSIYFYELSSGEYIRDYSVSFLSGRTKYFTPDDGYIAIVIANYDNSPIEDISELASKIRIFLTNDNYLYLKADDRAIANITGIKEISLPFEFGSSLTFIGDELWKFNPSEDDNSAQSLASSYIIDFEKEEIVQVRTLLINWGHVNTLNYSEYNDSIVFSNGNIEDTNERSKKFFVLENFTSKMSKSAIDISECIEYNVSSLNIENTKGLSVALQPCWGDCNDYRNNIIYLLWNDGHTKKISKILLGQGANDLGSGNFIPQKGDNEFNGTMKLITTYDGHDYTDKECTQDATYANGYIFEGIGHDGFWYDKIKLNEAENTFSKLSFQERHYSSDGNLYNSVTNGVAVRDGFLFSTVYHRANSDSEADYVKLVSRKLL
ncbi:MULTISPECIES: hypothetical protein [Enterococcus]|uniref:hypothetical protein n=1 Tax=Enterococcus TaxID=1350 RepID=UPI0010FF9FA7|nr:MULTISPECIES: hypothetical protein [Enterococcus]QCT92790.1 hypothetical protein FE005_12995 [Enterococcus sp. M190262]GMG56810.1 hypothetical protein AH4_02370 [Enterococcus gallinarum]